MRYDQFYGRKSVHVKLRKELHVALREKLFKFDITMQDLFHETAELVVSDTTRGDQLLQRIAKKKMLAMIQAADKKPEIRLNELDSDTLYNLISDGEDDNSESKESKPR